MSSVNFDLLNPNMAEEATKHKLKRLVQSPNSFFMDVKCPGCFQMYAPAHRHCVCVGGVCCAAIIRREGMPSVDAVGVCLSFVWIWVRIWVRVCVCVCLGHLSGVAVNRPCRPVSDRAPVRTMLWFQPIYSGVTRLLCSAPPIRVTPPAFCADR